MTALRGSARPLNEIDAVRWVSVAEARKTLTYPRDRKLLAIFAKARIARS
jgi:hypothetical protein